VITGRSRSSSRDEVAPGTVTSPGKRNLTYIRFRGRIEPANVPSLPVVSSEEVTQRPSEFVCTSTGAPASGSPSGPDSNPFSGTLSP